MHLFLLLSQLQKPCEYPASKKTWGRGGIWENSTYFWTQSWELLGVWNSNILSFIMKSNSCKISGHLRDNSLYSRTLFTIKDIIPSLILPCIWLNKCISLQIQLYPVRWVWTMIRTDSIELYTLSMVEGPTTIPIIMAYVPYRPWIVRLPTPPLSKTSDCPETWFFIE